MLEEFSLNLGTRLKELGAIFYLKSAAWHPELHVRGIRQSELLTPGGKPRLGQKVGLGILDRAAQTPVLFFTSRHNGRDTTTAGEVRGCKARYNNQAFLRDLNFFRSPENRLEMGTRVLEEEPPS